MNSVERLHYYAVELEQERAGIVKETEVVGWPSEGCIEFRGVEMRYLPDLPLVLKKISFSIKSKEKIGIVGRTGDGKSSLIQAVFRFVELSGGSILIDGVDISTLGLDTLRSSISCIFQTAILFSGTFRENLDPFGNHTDDELWEALETSMLKEKVSVLGGLDAAVLTGGLNLSAGEKQLLCLGRALLSKSNILFLDEATANVDYGTDLIIQKCIRNNFKDCTVVTIAHRLETVMDCDRVLVMGSGNVLEYGSPTDLLASKGAFYDLVAVSKGL